MTSAAIPIYDIKVNRNNESRKANLLGVAGTDVPIEEIDRLTLPYKVKNSRTSILIVRKFSHNNRPLFSVRSKWIFIYSQQ